MILDYHFSKKRQEFTISYIKENGAKALLKYNVGRFRSYYETDNGQFENWNGKRCAVRWTDKPEWCDILTFLKELPDKDRKLLLQKVNPKLYTFDIEVKTEDITIFPDPAEARWPITTISIVNDGLNAIVLGTKDLDDPDNQLQQWYIDYLNKCEFFKKLGLPKPKITYLKFDSEEQMIEYFLRQIVAKCPVMAGWNSLGFDWQYICNRIKYYYPNITLSMCSPDWKMESRNFTDMKGNQYRLSMPCHTLIMDMMDVIGSFDMAVMPIKENLSLDYIASESPVGLHKIKYEGDLNQLYERDYKKYVFYNAIDSVLVQLIDKCFKTLNSIYSQSLLMGNKIEKALSKIAITETMFFNYFYDNNIKIVPTEKFSGERGTLVGAYVRQPTPGKHNWVCCNDFASLYPSAIIVCNLSIENYLGCVEDGDFTMEDIERFKKDPNYFVSINNCVYKNDKDYAFKKIQFGLKKLRGKTKYLSKQLDATVMLDIEHILKGQVLAEKAYNSNIVEALANIGYDIKSTIDLQQLIDIKEFQRKLRTEITFMISTEQAIKLIMNSMYGGSSHVAFAFFNIRLANDITGEGRNIIHKMESHIPEYFKNHWGEMTDLHKKLGIKLKSA